MKTIAISVALAGLLGTGLFLASADTSFRIEGSEKSPISQLYDARVRQVLQARGAYLAQAGNCMGCHTAKGGRPYSGGHRLVTSIGTFVTPNITPDSDTGIGHWNENDFWRALHDGKGRNGTPLYPAFPYTEYTKVTREDSDAIFAYLQSLPSIQQKNPPSEIFFPFSLRPLIYIWRALYFEPGVYQPDPGKNDEWNRGGYLVQGLGHCNACHTARNPLGGSQGGLLGGGQLMGTNWYAPSLTSLQEGSISDWPIQEIVQLLKTGLSTRAATAGPMADVVSQSLQHLAEDDAHAMAAYLKSLPPSDPRSRGAAPPLTEEVDKLLARGGEIYKTLCEDCHGNLGQGRPNAYPALAGNRGVTLASPINAIRSILYGGYVPLTASNPRPYGMPPFAQMLHDDEIALVLSYIRNAWGNRGSLVTAIEVDRSRKGAQ
jgi:mono/diheme cytochrome c family protein